jgi:V8-like Glu-specific endopeptidase
MSSVFDEARDLVAQGQVEEAIDLLRELVSGQQASSIGSKLKNELLMQAATAGELSRARRLGLITPGKLQQQQRDLVLATLGLIDELERSLKAAQARLPVATPAVDLEPPVESRLEKVWGRNTLQSLSWLYKGLRAAKAVCRVVSPDGIGSGFMIAPGKVMTNNHVVTSARSAAETVVEFNFEEDERGTLKPVTSYTLYASKGRFVTSEWLDCSVLTLVPNEKKPFTLWGELTFAPDAKPEIGSHVSIIQHPSGGVKKISVTANEVVNIYEHRLQYMTDTLPGSSGSPVFDDSWKVVAIHHAGGNMVKNKRGDQFFANEGIMIPHIRKNAALKPMLP